MREVETENDKVEIERGRSKKTERDRSNCRKRASKK